LTEKGEQMTWIISAIVEDFDDAFSTFKQLSKKKEVEIAELKERGKKKPAHIITKKER
jgi:hypothetical protein